MSGRRVSFAAVVALVSMLVAPAAVLGQAPTFGEPTATAVLGQPITLTVSVTGGDVESVDAVLRLEGHETSIILDALPVEPAGTWQVQQEIDVSSSAFCACILEAPGPPNAKFEYQFRAHAADGSVTLGPVAQAVVTDARFEWRTLEQDLVRVHWYEGDEAFAAEVGAIANEAIDRAGALLGASLTEPVDLFVYDTQQALVQAVSPNRENVVGQFNPAITTMFVHVPNGQSAGAFAGEVIRHELTHLVFEVATENPYHAPPRWLDEGVAVYLSAGYSPYYRAPVDSAVRNRTLIPLQGLRGLFPATSDGQYLAYGESVAAVDFFVRTHGEPRLWELVNSYAEGLSDDDAFERAIGGTVEDFNRAWFQSLDLEPPGPAGPQPGQPGREPAEWQDSAPGTPAPSAGPGATVAPGSTGGSGTPGPGPVQPSTPTSGTDLTGVFIALAVLVLLVVGAAIVLIVTRQYRAERRPGPPGPPWY